MSEVDRMAVIARCERCRNERRLQYCGPCMTDMHEAAHDNQRDQDYAMAGLRAEIESMRQQHRGAVDLVERAVYPITMALNCSAHPWHGSDDARKWLMDAARLGGQ